MKNKLNLGSHNSMTYLKPKKWYMYPFQFMARCQSKSIEEQYEKYDIRVFDLRISYDINCNIEFRHGLIAYKGDVKKTLEYLNSRKTKVYVRLLLEVGEYAQDLEKQEWMFTLSCEEFEKNYPNIKFFCGRRKFDWKEVYKFKFKEPDIIQKVSSMQGSKLDDLWPWLYAKLNNRKSLREIDKGWLFLDFVEIK